MRILIAPDSFKGSITAVEMANCVALAVKKIFPEAETIKKPLSDGGEGLVDSLVIATVGKVITEKVTGPLGEQLDAHYGLLGDGKTAVIEMAEASGLPLVPENKRNPMLTTTYGTGELIKHALNRGCSRLIVGIGGSATNDGGVGMAQALGVRFLDNEGVPLPFGGGSLKSLAKIDISALDPMVKETEILVACDVDNPLTGKNGASYIYGPQKGATEEVVKFLDEGLQHYAKVLRRDLGIDVENIPGSGAAGGLGAGLLAFLNGKLTPGIDISVDVVGLEKELSSCDLVITGEGKLDSQSVHGKVPVGVARVAKKYNVPVIVLAGCVEEGLDHLHEEGITAYYSIVNGPMSLQEAITNTRSLVELTTTEILRLFKVFLPVGCASRK
ncbi:MAG: glycerate kinase [Bacillota bacterium]|nr:glycerate kinase [Bacillota bacterium]